MGALAFSLLALVSGVLLGVIFSTAFPLVEISSGIVALCAFGGCLVALAAKGATVYLKRKPGGPPVRP